MPYFTSLYILSFSFVRKKFEALMETFGSARMSHELSRLRSVNAQARKACLNTTATVASKRLKGIYKLWGKDLVGYQ